MIRPPAARNTILFILAATLAATAEGQERKATWQRGDAFRRQLTSRVSLTWTSNPLRDGLGTLSRAQRICIFLDRRVDPGLPLDFKANDVTLDRALRDLTSRQGLGMCYMDPVVYIGPPQTAEKLATLAAVKYEQVRQLPPELRTRLQRIAPWQWQILATPKDLIGQLQQRAGVEIKGIEQVPHDLWPAVDLPAMPWTHHLTLVLSGFDLTFQAEAAGLRLVAMPDEVRLQRTYRVRRDPLAALEKLQSRFPEVTIQRSGSRLTVSGSFEDHYRIRQILQGKDVDPPPDQEGEKRYTLTARNQLGRLAEAIAKRLELTLRVDPRVADKMSTQVSVEVTEATLDEMLKAMLSPVGLSYQLEAGVLEIVPGRQK